MLDKLMDYCEVNGSFESGLAYGAMTLSCERLASAPIGD